MNNHNTSDCLRWFRETQKLHCVSVKSDGTQEGSVPNEQNTKSGYVSNDRICTVTPYNESWYIELHQCDDSRGEGEINIYR